MVARKITSTQKQPMATRNAAALAAGAVQKVINDPAIPLDGLGPLDQNVRRMMIQTAAYFIAEQRGFAPGHELEDWCVAEAAIDATMLGLRSDVRRSATATV